MLFYEVKIPQIVKIKKIKMVWMTKKIIKNRMNQKIIFKTR
jgi:hypothetical protein